jgi:hypothetical protein
MNRRGFLKLAVSATVAATVPLPRLPDEGGFVVPPALAPRVRDRETMVCTMVIEYAALWDRLLYFSAVERLARNYEVPEWWVRVDSEEGQTILRDLLGPDAAL